MHTITGHVTVAAWNEPLEPLVGAYPGQPLEDLTGDQLDKLKALSDSLQQGKTYPCPQGAGGGYDDLVVGGQVVIADGSGSVLATSSLTGGVEDITGCTFDYTAQVPDATFYQITVTHRGALTYSREELQSKKWVVSALIG
jgi:hypothetical protein